jgi:hypothetical protein
MAALPTKFNSKGLDGELVRSELVFELLLVVNMGEVHTSIRDTSSRARMQFSKDHRLRTTTARATSLAMEGTTK